MYTEPIFTTDEACQVKEKFLVAGIITSPEFQKSRFLILKLYTSFPGQFERPEIRPMLDVQWEVYLTKFTTYPAKHTNLGHPVQSPQRVDETTLRLYTKNLVEIYKNDVDEDLVDECSHIRAYCLATVEKFEDCSLIGVSNYIRSDSFQDVYHNLDIVLRICLSGPATVLMKRTHGDGVWAIKRKVIIFMNERFLGDDKALTKHLMQKFRYSMNLDWYQMGKCHLIDIFKLIMDKYRQLTYMTISINSRVVGSLLFELYSELVPLACENFLNKCKDPVAGFTGTPIHRIMKNSWIQCGGWKLQDKHMRCENYAVPHDRRGVLCTTNDRRHKNNTTQFFITLGPTPWMDTKYVAFGQLLYGEDVLKQIESVPTYYEAPKYPITIVMSGEVTLDRVPDYLTSNERDEFQAMLPTILLEGLFGTRSDYDLVPQPTTYSASKFKKGIYGMETDMKSYLPFAHLPGYLMPLGGSEGGSSISSYDDFENLRGTTEHRVGNVFQSCSIPDLSDITI